MPIRTGRNRAAHTKGPRGNCPLPEGLALAPGSERPSRGALTKAPVCRRFSWPAPQRMQLRALLSLTSINNISKLRGWGVGWVCVGLRERDVPADGQSNKAPVSAGKGRMQEEEDADSSPDAEGRWWGGVQGGGSRGGVVRRRVWVRAPQEESGADYESVYHHTHGTATVPSGTMEFNQRPKGTMCPHWPITLTMVSIRGTSL